MLANDMKEGMKVTFWDGRTGVIRDNKRGIIRTVEIDARNGFFNDIGSCYISEISSCEGEKLELTPAHKKQLERVGQYGIRYL